MTDNLKINKFLSGKFPGQLIVQLTNKCNAMCPQCSMNAGMSYKRTTLKADKIKKIIEHAHKKNIKALSVTGGEPFLYPQTTKDILLFARENKIRYTRTGTNGFFFSRESSSFNKKVISAARLVKRSKVRNFWISIDSCDPETHENIRGFKRLVEGIYHGLPYFRDMNIYPCANLGINRAVGGQKTLELKAHHYNSKQKYLTDFQNIYEDAFNRFFNFVSELGFTMANCCYPMSTAYDETTNPVYSAASSDDIVSFHPKEKAAIFRALAKSVEKSRDKIRIFTPLCSLYQMSQQYENNMTPYPCRGGKNFFFLQAETARLYPCGFRDDMDFGEKIPHMNKIKEPYCTKCDWECFRDPSSLLTPFFQIASSPLKGFKKLKKNNEFYELWKKDISYYRACDFFNGTKAPDLKKLVQYHKINPAA